MSKKALITGITGQDGSDDFNAVRNRAGVEPREMTAETLLDERLLDPFFFATLLFFVSFSLPSSLP